MGHVWMPKWVKIGSLFTVMVMMLADRVAENASSNQVPA